MKKITVIACLLALLTLSACGAETLPADEKDVPPVEGISQTQEDGQTEGAYKEMMKRILG